MQHARQLAGEVYILTATKPLTNDYRLCSQMQAAAVSVMSNIALRPVGRRSFMYMPFNQSVVGCILARQMIWGDAFLSIMRAMLNQQGQTNPGTCLKSKRSQLAEKPATLNGNSRNRGNVVVNTYKSEVATRRTEGFERTGKDEKLHFYNIARSSCGEVQSQLYVVEDVYSELAESAKNLRASAVSTGRSASGLMASTEKR